MPTSAEDNDTIQVAVKYIMGTKGTATLDVTGKPTGVEVSFQPNSVEPDFYSNMTIHVYYNVFGHENASLGNHVLTIVVKDNKGATIGSVPFNLEITPSS